jgi:phosphotransferase system enzyme I (PtsP)
LEALALIAIGYRGLSMSPASIGPVKAMILSLNAGAVTRFVGDLLSANDGASSLREKLRSYAEAHGIPV